MYEVSPNRRSRNSGYGFMGDVNVSGIKTVTFVKMSAIVLLFHVHRVYCSHYSTAHYMSLKTHFNYTYPNHTQIGQRSIIKHDRHQRLQ